MLEPQQNKSQKNCTYFMGYTAPGAPFTNMIYNFNSNMDR